MRQDETRQDKTRQDKTRQDKTIQDKTRRDETGQVDTRQAEAREDKARYDCTRLRRTTQGYTRQHKTRLHKTRQAYTRPLTITLDYTSQHTNTQDCWGEQHRPPIPAAKAGPSATTTTPRRTYPRANAIPPFSSNLSPARRGGHDSRAHATSP